MKYQHIKQYKYKLNEAESAQTHINDIAFEHELFELHKSGELVIFKGYLWDGVSGPTWDTDNTMLGGLIHDALYQAIRLELIPSFYKEHIDLLFKDILLKQGMFKFRAWYYYTAVNYFGTNSCAPGDIRIPAIQEVV